MPLPLIPIIIMAASALAAGKGAVDAVNAAQRINAAIDRYNWRRKEYETKFSNYNSERENAERNFEELGSIRLHSLVVLGRVVEVLKNANIKERDLQEKFDITPQTLKSWETASVRALEVLGGVTSASLTGVSTAAAAYGLVGLLGTASTGTAIATLSGAAATNATLAWLGGGALAAGGGGIALGTLVLGGLVAGPAILVVGFFAQGKAGEIENQVNKSIAEMEIAEAQMGQQISILHIILRRIDELKTSTIEIRNKVEELLQQLTSESPLEDLYFLARTAKSLGDLLDVAILDKNGNLIQ
ncbi:MAG: hypothetical protein C0425_10025 [Chlorobiaceae bacterium]|nr:hypothetical protein [Chlorobiaceae bacterium]MBA4310656.1 hypothetical protein [Chlorobiaceae bacterium]